MIASYINMVKLRIKEEAREHGLTLADVAKRLGIKPTSLSQALARNSFSTDKLEDIANAIGCNVIDLFEKNRYNGASVICPHCGKNIEIEISIKNNSLT